MVGQYRHTRQFCVLAHFLFKFWLECEFEEEEISAALIDCAGDKSPGLDGFNFSLTHVAWGFVKDNFRAMWVDFGSFE